MKDSYGLKIGLGLFAVIILIILEVVFGLITGVNAMIPLGMDPIVQLLSVMGILTVFMLVVFLYVKKTYMK